MEHIEILRTKWSNSEGRIDCGKLPKESLKSGIFNVEKNLSIGAEKKTKEVNVEIVGDSSFYPVSCVDLMARDLPKKDCFKCNNSEIWILANYQP